MKKIIKWLLVMGVIAGVVYVVNRRIVRQTTDVTAPESPAQEAVPVLDKMESIKLNTLTYKYALVKVDRLDKLRLIPNFENRLGSENLIRRDECSGLVNGGFYSKDNEPIGWFYSGDEELQSPEKNDLFNGYVSVATDSATISQNRQMKNLVSGFQTGPLLANGGVFRNLSIIDDEARRRVAAITDDEGKLYFGVVTGVESLILGPKLADLPQVINNIIEKEGIVVEGAINLDGGSASVFFDGDIYVREATYIGSYFCLKP